MTDTRRYSACADVREDLSAYFDGELSPEDREAVDAHLRDCADCLRELNALKRVDDAYANLGAVKAAEDFDAGVRRAVQDGKTTVFPQRSIVPRWAGPLVAVAAAAAVVFTGVVLLEWQQGTRTDVAMAPAETAALPSPDTRSDPEAQSAAGGRWDSFTANAPVGEARRGAAEGAGADTDARWEDFVSESGSSEGAKEEDVAAREADPAPEEEFLGRADEGALRQSLAASTPAAPESEEQPSTNGDADRAAVLGEPPATLPTARAEALKGAAQESERNRDEARARLESDANRAAAAGEVVGRSVLRSFKVGADGTWYEAGYDGEVTTPLARGSDALREVMKEHPEFDWNKLLDRSARQIFQLDGAWYDLAAGAEQG